MAKGEEPTGRRAWRRWFVRGLMAALATLAVGGAAATVGYQRYVVDAGPSFERHNLLAIVADESPVTYRDGATRLGVFFEDEHRAFVPFDELPQPWVAAIVAAEDARFWSHPGIDALGIARAMVHNVWAGQVVAGGSTLTQQTAKNLFYRPDRSLRSKTDEALNALRLERHYSKRDILGFYANQFHVTGNGRGLGIAARYFFDVGDPRELGLLECAFLAGLVKAPSAYDPFVGDEARRAKASEAAHRRTRYVLERIVAVSAEDLAGPGPAGDAASQADWAARVSAVDKMQAEAARLLADGFTLPFRHGEFRYESNAVLDEVARRLGEAPFPAVLDRVGVEDPATAGLVVVTTLDPVAQREAEYALWHHLTELGTELEALTIADFVHVDGVGPIPDAQRPTTPHAFRTARVIGPVVEKGRQELDLDLGGPTCRVDRDALVRVAASIERGRRADRGAKVGGAQVDAVVAGLSAGSIVTASVREVGPAGARCDLEVRPELQGAVVVIEDGRVRAMVGGNDNRNFNRATALRQFGSTWKPLVYHAAMELGWSPTDELDNRRNVFPFSTTDYAPSPDHAPTPFVSLAWAGVNSENLASIWLLYHLTDPLDGEQVAALARSLGLARGAGEPEEAYRLRIQKAGVLPSPKRIPEILFLQARHEVASGELGFPEDRVGLWTMGYGPVEGGDAWRVEAQARTWGALEARIEPCTAQYRSLAAAVQVAAPVEVPDLRWRRDGDQVALRCGQADGFQPIDEAFFAAVRPPAPLAPTLGERLGALFGVEEAPPAPPANLPPEEAVWMADHVHLGSLTALRRGIERRAMARAGADESASGVYDPELLYAHPDFRVLLGLRYVGELASRFNVRTPVKEVVSMPLGASEITLEEATVLYDGLLSGSAFDAPGRVYPPMSLLGEGVEAAPAPALLVERVSDVDGRTLYEARPVERRVTSPVIGALTADILRNAVEHGTGRRAAGAVRVDGLPVPVGGKTGTTNDFRNVAFVGFVPHADGAGFALAGGWTVGVYVGYDDNRPMSRGGIRVAGASGALPAWIGAARGLVAGGLLGAPSGAPVGLPTASGDTDVAPVLPTMWPLDLGFAGERRAVDPATGLPEDAEPPRATVLAPMTAPAPTLDLAPAPVRPVRIAPRTDAPPPPAAAWWSGERGD